MILKEMEDQVEQTLFPPQYFLRNRSTIGTAVAAFSGSETSKKQDSTAMNEFLLLALGIVYLAISYSPISQASKGDWRRRRSERSSGETDGDRRQ
jgi:hypothetical protein